jgi:extracellular solute-binding protein family 5
MIKKERSIQMKKLFALFLALSLCLALFTACSSNGSNSDEQTGGKNSLVLGVQSDLGSFDIANGQFSLDFIIRRCLYEPLIHVDPVTGEEFMRLAEKYEKSDDDLTYTFYLRKDVKMHDGSTLTADDVVYSLNMTKASADVGKNLSAMKEARAVDDYTVEIELDVPYAAFMKGLSMVFILSAKAYESLGSDGFNEAPVGCGPYQFVSYENESKIILKAFADYYRGVAPIENIEIRQFADANALAIAMEGEELDAAAAIAPINYEDITSNKNIVVSETATTKFGLAAMNTQRAPFDNKLLRQAINYALDREFILNACREGIGNPSSLLFNSVMSCTAGVREYTYDLDKVAELLKEAGLSLPCTLDVPITTYASCKAEAEAVQGSLKEVGIEMEIEILETGAFFASLASGDIGFAISRLGTSAIDPDQYYNMVSENGYSSINYAWYANPEVEQLMLNARKEMDGVKRDEIYREALTIIQDDAPYAILYEMPDLNASVKGLNVNWGLNGMYYLYDFSWN